ncbi:MAG: DNA N-6-adenine-methyltransferase [Candidatus Adiutricales bacterium]
MEFRFGGLDGSGGLRATPSVGQVLVMWYTPQVYIDAAREVMGDIDLDPASDDRVQERIKASKYYTIHTNGLDKPWFGRVWLNSPYDARVFSEFVTKAIVEYNRGNVTELIFLTHTEETYSVLFQMLGHRSSAVCFHQNPIEWEGDHTGVFSEIDGVKLDKPKEAHYKDVGVGLDVPYTLHGSVFFYFGINPGKFKEVFSRFGWTI